jgi:hypothetical protein
MCRAKGVGFRHPIVSRNIVIVKKTNKIPLSFINGVLSSKGDPLLLLKAVSQRDSRRPVRLEGLDNGSGVVCAPIVYNQDFPNNVVRIALFL